MSGDAIAAVGGEIGMARVGDRAELLDFLLSVFRRARPDHPPFDTLYPDIFDDTDADMGRHAVIRDRAGRIVACVGAYPMMLRVAGYDIPTAGIGQIATAADWLGRGCMTALLKLQLQRLRDAGVAIAWLGGRHDRYGRFGFETGGLSFDFTLDAGSLRDVATTRVVRRHTAAEAPAVVTESMLAMRDATAPAVVLEPLARWRRRLARFGGCEVWTAAPDGDATPDAWAVRVPFGKSSCLTECSGVADGILEIAKGVAAETGGEVSVSSPPQMALCGILRDHCAGISPRCSMLAVLDRDRLLAAYAPAIRPGTRLPPRDSTLAELVRTLFGPWPSPVPMLPMDIPILAHV
jgi:GNAT superfamily N-acetyltransferase